TRLIIPALLVALFIVVGILNYAASVSLQWVGYKVVMDLRLAMFRRLVALPARYYAESSSGSLISRLTFDAAQVMQAATQALQVAVQDGASILALVGYMVYLNWKLSRVILVIGPPMVLAVRAVSRRLRDMSRKVQSSMGAITHVAEESIEGHKEVKIF